MKSKFAIPMKSKSLALMKSYLRYGCGITLFSKSEILKKCDGF